MIQTTYGGQAVFILNDAPSWLKGYSTEFDSPTDYQQSLTMRETRRPYASTLRTVVKQTCVVSGASLRLLQGSLRGLKAQPVLNPFWPAVSFWSARASMKIVGGLLIAYKRDWSQYEIYLNGGAEPGWPLASDLVAPLLWGFLKSADAKFINVDAATLPVEFTEASQAAYALSFVSGAFATGPTPAGYASPPTLLPFRQDHRDVTESFVVAVSQRDVGFQREQSRTFYPQDVHRAQVARLTVSGASNVATLLAWFDSVAGEGGSFWAASSLSVGYLANDALAGDTALTWGDANVIAGDYICTWKSDGSIATAKISTVVGNVITVATAFGVALKAGQPFYALSLARLDRGKLTLNWASPTLVSATLRWSEVRPETLVPGSETLGTTIGKLAQRIVLFDFYRDFGNGTVTHYRFTSYEADVTYSANVYAHGPYSAGDVSTSLNLEEDSCEIESMLTKPDATLDTNNPLVLDVILGAEAPLKVVITFADYDGITVTNATQVFSGDCVDISRAGNVVKASCKLGSSLFDTELPVLVKGVMCPHLRGSPGDGTHLISQGCTGPDAIMLRSKWKFTGLVANPISVAYPYALKLGTLVGVGTSAAAALAGAGIFANWFGYGVVEWGAGANVQRRLIIGSTVVSGGTITLTLHRYFGSAPALNDVVTFYPGCDGVAATCQAFDATDNPTGKYGNFDNFGGDPQTPTGNPTTTGQPTLGVQGAKK